MNVRDDIRQALYDGIGWQEGLADAYGKDSPEGRDALARMERYKRILKRRYGTSMTALDRKLKDAKLMPALPR